MTAKLIDFPETPEMIVRRTQAKIESCSINGLIIIQSHAPARYQEQIAKRMEYLFHGGNDNETS